MKKLLSKNDTIIILLCKNPELMCESVKNENYSMHVIRALSNYLNRVDDTIHDLKNIYLAIDKTIKTVINITGEDSELIKAYRSGLANSIIRDKSENQDDVFSYKISMLSSLRFTEENISEYDNPIIFINGFSKVILGEAYALLSKIRNMNKHVESIIGKMLRDNITNKLYLVIGLYNDLNNYENSNLILMSQYSFEKYYNKINNYLPSKSSFKITKFNSISKKYTLIGQYNFMEHIFKEIVESFVLNIK